MDMRFRLGLATGLATGYYLGTRAGRPRYDQINRAVAKLRRSDAFEQATDRAKAVVEDGVEKALSVVGARGANGQAADPAYDSGPGYDGAGLIVTGETGPGEAPGGPGDYSSSR